MSVAAGQGPLDAELAALVARAGATLASVRELTTLPSPVFERPAWRLELRDGRVWKGRLFPSAAEAERFVALAALLPERGFARVHDRQGRAVLLEWVAGQPVGTAPSAELLARCGERLGELHRRTAPAEAAVRASSGPGALPEPLEPLLDLLAAAGWLEPAEARALGQRAAQSFPARCERGLVHLDYCAENLVLTPGGEPVAIDNATLCLAPLDYDLARVELRWPLAPTEREAFLAGYRRWRGTAEFDACADYWRIAAHVHSARLRLLRRTGDVARPVAGLRRLLAEDAPARAAASSAQVPLRLRYGACALDAVADEPADLAWLREFLCPWFEPASAGGDAQEVALRRRRADFEAARAAGPLPGATPLPAFLADAAPLALEPWSAPPGTTRFRDASADVFLEREGPRAWRVLAAPGAHFARVAWMRVLRELATRELAARGAALLHAAAVERAGTALAFVGAKRSGKTSCLLFALSAPGVRFVANDRVAVLAGARPAARGMPTIVNLRADTLDAFPELGRRVRAADARVASRPGESLAGQPEWPRSPGSAGLGSAAFLAAAEAFACAQAPLAALAFPRVSGSAGSYAVARLAADEALARLQASELLAGAPHGGPFAAREDAAGRAALLERLAAELPCLDLRLDREAFAGDPARMLDALAGAR